MNIVYVNESAKYLRKLQAYNPGYYSFSKRMICVLRRIFNNKRWDGHQWHINTKRCNTCGLRARKNINSTQHPGPWG